MAIATINAIQGNPIITTADGSQLSAMKGMQLNHGDRVFTEAGEYVNLLFAEGGSASCGDGNEADALSVDDAAMDLFSDGQDFKAAEEVMAEAIEELMAEIVAEAEEQKEAEEKVAKDETLIEEDAAAAGVEIAKDAADEVVKVAEEDLLANEEATAAGDDEIEAIETEVKESEAKDKQEAVIEKPISKQNTEATATSDNTSTAPANDAGTSSITLQNVADATQSKAGQEGGKSATITTALIWDDPQTAQNSGAIAGTIRYQVSLDKAWDTDQTFNITLNVRYFNEFATDVPLTATITVPAGKTTGEYAISWDMDNSDLYETIRVGDSYPSPERGAATISGLPEDYNESTTRAITLSGFTVSDAARDLGIVAEDINANTNQRMILGPQQNVTDYEGLYDYQADISNDPNYNYDNLFGDTDTATTIIGGEAGDYIYNSEAVTTPVVIYAGEGNDDIVGGSADDRLFGGSGNDFLTGGAGDDTLTGGAGRDIFVITPSDLQGAGSEYEDTITDFTIGEDVIRLSELNLGENAFVNFSKLNDTDLEVEITNEDPLAFIGTPVTTTLILEDVLTQTAVITDRGISLETEIGAYLGETTGPNTALQNLIFENMG